MSAEQSIAQGEISPIEDKKELLVVKYGSESCTDENGIRTDRLAFYAGQIAEQHAQGRDVVAIISGAVAVANTLLPECVNRRESVNNQMRATFGNPYLMKSWQDALLQEGMIGGELLVTSHDIDAKGPQQMLTKIIRQHLNAGWVSLVNENDGLSDEEIRELTYGGDNDGLARLLAIRLGATELCFMTEKEGLLDQRGNRLHRVRGKDIKKALSLAQGPGPMGRGGMKSKVQAALLASQNGINSHIAPAYEPLSDVIAERVGTHFETASTAV